MLVQTGSTSGPSDSGTCSVSHSRASGISRHKRRAAPMSTLTRPPAAARASRRPAAVSTTTRSLPVSRMTSAATQRVPLPQASTSPPSALRMRMKISAPGALGFSRMSSWSQPTPVCRSAIARAALPSSASAWARASSTTKSFPSPFILRKLVPRMRGYIRRAV